MRVVVPYVPRMLHPAVVAAIEAQQYTAELADVSASPLAYYELLRRLWAEGDSFIVVEHDIEVPPGALTELEHCWGLWCAHSYPVHFGDLMTLMHPGASLGCTRFSWQLIAHLPELFDLVPHMGYENGEDGRHYLNLDKAVASLLIQNNAPKAHRHFPDVANHKDAHSAHAHR